MTQRNQTKWKRRSVRAGAAVLIAVLTALSTGAGVFAAEKTETSAAAGIQQRTDTGIASVRVLKVENGRLYAEGDVIGNDGVVTASLHEAGNGYIASSPAVKCTGKAFSLSFNLIRGELEDGSYYVVFGEIENTGISVRDLWSTGYKVSFEAKDNQVLDTWKGGAGGGKTPSASAGDEGKKPPELKEPQNTEQQKEQQGQEPQEIPEEQGTPAETSPVSDISGHWAEKDIRSLKEAGILSGYEDGSFHPEKTITRAEFAQAAAAAFGVRYEGGAEGRAAETGEAAVQSAGRFTDVSRDDWYWEAVAALAERGIVSGVSETSFAPEEAISREQMTVILFNAAKDKQMDLAIKRDNTTFTDDSDISDYAKEAVRTMYQAGLISGVGAEEGNRFLPQEGAARAEVAALVNKLLNQMKK